MGVQRFTPLFIDAARPCRHSPGDRWFVDETYLKVGGRWRYLYRAVDQFGQVIDVYLSNRRDATAARAFFDSAIAIAQTEPVEVVTDRAHAYIRVIEDRVPAAWHHVERYANNPIECDHGRLKARLRPMRGLKRQRSARVVVTGHAFVQNLRRGHYELGVQVPANASSQPSRSSPAPSDKVTPSPSRAPVHHNATAPSAELPSR